MIRIFLLILIIVLTLFSVVVAVSFDTATSAIPGWHTTVIDISWIFYMWIFIMLAFYYGIYKTKVRVNKTLVILHILLTVPLPVISILTTNLIINQSSIFVVTDLLRLRFLFIILFLIGQLLFIYQLINIYKKQKAQLR